jgi:5,10-methylenetetrahydromethanopterin reductase
MTSPDPQNPPVVADMFQLELVPVPVSDIDRAKTFYSERAGFHVDVRAGADRAGRRLDGSFDLCASVLGAISSDSGAAKEAARVAAAFYISSMAPELVERHGISYSDVRPVVDAFGRGDVERALELTTLEIGERLSIAGDPAEWVERLRSDFAPHGYDHVALGLVDPSLVENWSGRRIDGVPSLAGQLELFADRVVPALKT